jgi:putative flippase GtrA
VSGDSLKRQGLVFAIVGASATAVHAGVAFLAKQQLHMSAIEATTTAYCVAVGVSYFGNARFTFRRAVLHGPQMARFAVVSLSGLLLNLALTWLLVNRLGLPFWFGLGVVVVAIPALSFVASRLWAFRDR